jgi:hypothetical protein
MWAGSTHAGSLLAGPLWRAGRPIPQHAVITPDPALAAWRSLTPDPAAADWQQALPDPARASWHAVTPDPATASSWRAGTVPSCYEVHWPQ